MHVSLGESLECVQGGDGPTFMYFNLPRGVNLIHKTKGELIILIIPSGR